MIHYICYFTGGKSYIDRYESCPDHEYCIVGFQHGRDIRTKKGDLVAFLDPDPAKGARQAIHSVVKLLVCITLVLMYDGGFVRKDGCAADQETDRSKNIKKDFPVVFIHGISPFIEYLIGIHCNSAPI